MQGVAETPCIILLKEAEQPLDGGAYRRYVHKQYNRSNSCENTVQLRSLRTVAVVLIETVSSFV